MQVHGDTKSWLSYWRNSLIDAESTKGALKENELAPLPYDTASAFERGRLVSEKRASPDTETLLKLFEGELVETQLVKTVIRPVIYRSKIKHGKELSIQPDIISPIVCHVWISRSGHFYPAKLPSVPRDLLTPQDEKKLTIYDVTELDKFTSLNNAKIYSEKDALNSLNSTDDQDNRNNAWSNYCEVTQKLHEQLRQRDSKTDWLSHYVESSNEKSYFEKIEKVDGAIKNIVKLYDWLSLNKSKLPLLDSYATVKFGSRLNCLDSLQFISKRLGHPNSKFPLALAQRDSLSHTLNMSDGEILGINGPPGTGKTTLILSVVASLWVDAAIKKEKPPFIVATSANNQPVKNIITAFEKDFENDDSAFSGRWITQIRSFGGYYPAPSKEKDEARNYQTEAFYRELEQSEQLNRIEATFIQKAQEAFGDPSLESVEIIKDKLHLELVNLHKELSQIEQSWAALKKAQDRCLGKLGKNPIATYDISKKQLEIAEEELTNVSSDLNSWRNHLANESALLLLFKWLPPIGRKLLLLREIFIDSSFSEKSLFLIQDEQDVEKRLSKWINQKKSDLEQLKVEHASIGLLYSDWVSAKKKWHSDVLTIFPILSDIPSMTDVDSSLDVTTRFKLFQLTVHYWEAEWLLDCRAMEAKGGTDWARHRKTGYKAVMPRWRRRMMLTPCVVSTFQSLPKHLMYCFHSQSNSFEDSYLTNEIDLLIVDEAGQVAPNLAAASFSLAKKALVIGDTHQIKPIRSVSGSVDCGNLIQSGVIDHSNQYNEVCETGGTLLNGSVMHIAQRASRYHYDKKADAGMFLYDHHRCFEDIISFSNELCYQGLLKPHRGKAPSCGPFPAMAYLHIDGFAESPPEGGRFNALEANQIANWLAQNREKIESFYRGEDSHSYDKTLEDFVGVITPFKAQKSRIIKACKDQGIKVGDGSGELTVGTVHALQGAERKIVIFSSVYSRHSDGNFIDNDKSILNVAVSRAKDSFIVFGDMEVMSGAQPGKPRNLLAKYLFSSVANQLVMTQEKRPDLLTASATPRLINNAEEHDNYILQVLKNAKSDIHMVSPWVSIQRLKEVGLFSAMVSAYERGVKVNLYTDNHFNTTSGNKIDNAKKVIFSEICEELCSAGIYVHVINGVHSKLIMSDNKFMSVGSFNWASASRRGRYVNMETSMIYTGDLRDEICIQLDYLKRKVKKTYQLNKSMAGEPI